VPLQDPFISLGLYGVSLAFILLYDAAMVIALTRKSVKQALLHQPLGPPASHPANGTT